MAPVESPVDDGDRDADGHTGEGNRLASGNLDGLLGWGHHLGRHWGDQSRSEGFEGQSGSKKDSKESGRERIEARMGEKQKGPHPVPPAFAPSSLQPNSSLRSGQSLSSSQWKLAGMHLLVETHRNCVGPHTSSGCFAAGGQSQVE
jgi:hypothetical protein